MVNLEDKWRAEFEKLYVNKLDLTVESTQPLNYENGKTSWAWHAYQSARRKAQEEIDSIMVEREQFKAEGIYRYNEIQEHIERYKRAFIRDQINQDKIDKMKSLINQSKPWVNKLVSNHIGTGVENVQQEEWLKEVGEL